RGVHVMRVNPHFRGLHAELVGRAERPAAFVPTNRVPRGVYGNAGRGLISGPAQSSTDLALLKDFVFREPMRLQFRTEWFNALNQTNFSNPTTTVNSSTFGRIRAAADGRTIQMALKFLW